MSKKFRISKVGDFALKQPTLSSVNYETSHYAHILSPTDLVVSKLARFADNDKEDIMELVRYGLTSSEEIEERAMQALGGFVGGQKMLLYNIRDALELTRKIEQADYPVPRL